MAIDTDALARQAATQGQQMLDQDNANAAQYKSSFDNYQSQADAANKQVGDYTNYMANEGSAGNQYDTALKSQLGDLGYDQGQMTAARNNLNQSTGALSAYSDFANTGAAKWGQNAGGFAAANSGALGSLNNNIASNQQVANGLQGLYTTAQTGANARTGQVVQGEQNTLAGYQQQFKNASDQRDSAATQMQFWANLASSQGGLNAQQQQAYAQSKQLYAAAGLAGAQARLAIAQSVGQEQANATATANMGKKTPATSTPVKNPAPAPVHNQYFNVNSSNAPSLLHSIGGDLVNGAISVGNFFGGNNQLMQNDKTLKGWGG